MNKPQYRREDLLPGVDVSKNALDTKFWLTVNAFLDYPDSLEEQTSRWQEFIKVVYFMSSDRKKAVGSVDGSINPAALSLLKSASQTPLFDSRTTETTTSTTTDTDEEVDDLDSEDEEPPSFTPRTNPEVAAPIRAPKTPTKSNNKVLTSCLQLSRREGSSSWSHSWTQIMQSHVTTGWAAGIFDVVNHMFSIRGVNDLVVLADRLFSTKEIIIINDDSKNQRDRQDTADPSRNVVLRFKELWDATETAAFSSTKELFCYFDLGVDLQALEAQLDQIDTSEPDQLGPFAKRYLSTRHGKRETETTRATFVSQHFLDVLGYTRANNFDAKDIEKKKRLLKAQRMTAKNVKAFADVLSQGCLFLMWNSVWRSALDQVSEKTLKPLLQDLAAKEPELRKFAELAERVGRYAKDKLLICDMPKVVIRAQEIAVEKRKKFTMAELLGPVDVDAAAAVAMCQGDGADGSSEEESDGES